MNDLGAAFPEPLQELPYGFLAVTAELQVLCPTKRMPDFVSGENTGSQGKHCRIDPALDPSA
jgi:hypothetical protein